MTSKIKTADEVVGTNEWDRRADRIDGLVALERSWSRAFRSGGARDIVYVAKLQRRIRVLKQRLK